MGHQFACQFQVRFAHGHARRRDAGGAADQRLRTACSCKPHVAAGGVGHVLAVVVPAAGPSHGQLRVLAARVASAARAHRWGSAAGLVPAGDLDADHGPEPLAVAPALRRAAAAGRQPATDRAALCVASARPVGRHGGCTARPASRGLATAGRRLRVWGCAGQLRPAESGQQARCREPDAHGHGRRAAAGPRAHAAAHAAGEFGPRAAPRQAR
mmetsp:Transcript_41543/g.129456  ORF Transcript_41543/g.129456 Transcript_41543/m.129456 type:complete len:213 (+) Transcript_41543:1810-2448(+)